MTYNETEQLIQRYLEGETTPQEEQQLALEVSRQDAPEDWKLIAEMLGTLTIDEALYDQEMRRREEVAVHTEKKKMQPIRKRMAWMWTAAACLIAAAITVPMVWGSHTEPDMVAYVYGEEITDPEAVMQLMASTMEDVLDNGPSDPVAQLEGIFGN